MLLLVFLGETDDEFNDTYEFLKEINFSKMHIFKYSPRKGTKAASFPNQIDGKVKQKRSEVLIDLSNKNEELFASQYIGKEISVLFENEEEGHTSNYIKVVDKSKRQSAGIINVVIPTGFEKDYLFFDGV